MITMFLRDQPFSSIKNGSKKVEMRLYDEKRRLIEIGEQIEFTNTLSKEKLYVKVVALTFFKDFEKLYNNYDKTLLGYEKDEIAHHSDMEKYYSLSEQQKYGVLAIEIEVI